MGLYGEHLEFVSRWPTGLLGGRECVFGVAWTDF